MSRSIRRNEALQWLSGQKHDLGILTGQDTRALVAIAQCLELYACADDDGHAAALGAIRHLLNGMQRKCWPLAKSLIPWALDWSDEDRVWKLLDIEDLHAAGEPETDETPAEQAARLLRLEARLAGRPLDLVAGESDDLDETARAVVSLFPRKDGR